VGELFLKPTLTIFLLETILGIITLTKQPQSLVGTPRPDSGAGEPAQIEVTPEMIEAGASVIGELYGVVDSYSLAGRVYIAMVALETRPRPGGRPFSPPQRG
jgi:hypothetical protein